MDRKRFRKIIISSFIRITFEHSIVILPCSAFILTAKEYKNSMHTFNFVLCLLIIIFILKFIYFIIKQIIEIKKIDKTEYSKIEKQLKKPIFYSRWNYILLNEYIINIRRFKIIKYSDIVWVYKSFGINPNTTNYLEQYIYIITKSGNKYKFLINYPLFVGPFTVEDFTEVIKLKNYGVLFGKNSKNEKTIKKRYNIEF